MFYLRVYAMGEFLNLKRTMDKVLAITQEILTTLTIKSQVERKTSSSSHVAIWARDP